jgi:hypothetical protein
MPLLPASPTKEGRYWAFEFPIAILVIVGSIVLAFGIPHIVGRSTDWATMFIGAGEGLAALAVFYLTRLNMIRVITAAVFAAGAAAFYVGLSAVY